MTAPDVILSVTRTEGGMSAYVNPTVSNDVDILGAALVSIFGKIEADPLELQMAMARAMRDLGAAAHHPAPVEQAPD